MKNLASLTLASMLVVAGFLAPTSTATASAGSLLDPSTDPFYAVPANLTSLHPGALIRQRAVTVLGLGVGGVGLPLPVRSTEILVRSNDSHGRPVAVSATVIVPLHGDRHQLVSYQPAIDGLGPKCEPSYTMRDGTSDETHLIALYVLAGYTVVVPDHEGPRNAFAAGIMAGHAVLDSIRATLRLPQAALRGSLTKVGMVGYSGGAIATGWAAQLRPTYAPELHVVGVVSGGTPANLAAAGAVMDGSLYGGGLFVGAAIGVAREYPRLFSLLNAAGRAYAQRIKDECKIQLAANLGASVRQLSDYPDPLATPVAQQVLNTLKMGRISPHVPYLLFHSTHDELIPIASAHTLFLQWCALGNRTQWMTNSTSEHVLGIEEMQPVALRWLTQRFNDSSFAGNCP